MLNMNPTKSSEPNHALDRLVSLAPFNAQDLSVLARAINNIRTLASRRDLIVNGSTTSGPMLIVEGWAVRSCILRDGRRQILNVILPGDVIPRLSSSCVHAHSITTSTRVRYCYLPDRNQFSDASRLDEALAISQGLDVDFLYRQITRVGRLSALERVADWLLEICERLNTAGQCTGNSFALPLTQEAIADVLGLTSVHVNRTLMVLRRNGLIHVEGGRAVILDYAGCRQLIGSES